MLLTGVFLVDLLNLGEEALPQNWSRRSGRTGWRGRRRRTGEEGREEVVDPRRTIGVYDLLLFQKFISFFT